MSLREIPESELGDNDQERWLWEQEQLEHDRREHQRKLESDLNSLSSLLARLAALPSDRGEQIAASVLYDAAVARLVTIKHEILPVLS